MINILEDISTLTSINKKALDKLSNVAIYCINDAVVESLITDNDTVKVDIGIGELWLRLENDQVKYKFIPSAKFEESIVNTITNKSNLLEISIENSLKEKITNTYKDLT